MDKKYSKIIFKKNHIHHLSGKVPTIYPSVLKKQEIVNALCRQHDNLVLVPADKARGNIVFVKVNIMNGF
jgi:hypothetical protein